MIETMDNNKSRPKIDLTYGGKINAYITGGKKMLETKKVDVDFTIDGELGIPTTTSIMIEEEPLFMITFDYLELKDLLEGRNNASSK